MDPIITKAATPNPTVKKSLINMYSDILDELNDYDSNYQTQDHLPRVIVIGDQSSGKTSVLEMIAQARIFPRGAGEMMTRAPVEVTLSEGPYHVAQFKDSAREFDLTKESELAELRKEVEARMKNTVSRGNLVSNRVISMTIRGPGLQRMVLVDLPGIISSVTQGMAHDTRECIHKMCTAYMSNPNAIILCIQDGSVDAERSNVTDLVSQIDPHGRRTILVLTKVDLAEKNMANAERVNKILSGSIYSMKALGIYAVVTGKDHHNYSIDSIQKYEEDFFRNSKLFKESIYSSQFTTHKLSIAVSDCFWKNVCEQVEQQANSYKQTRRNLENEWKNNFPRYLEMDRDELFQKARVQVLDEVLNLRLVSVNDWEKKLGAELWDNFSKYLIEKVYLPAGYSVNQTNSTDSKLEQWAEEQLPRKSINIGSVVLKDMFKTMFEENQKLQASDDILLTLKMAVIDEALKRHSWEDKALEMLRSIQLYTLEDRSIKDQHNWDEAAHFLTSTLENNLKVTDGLLKEMIGPSNYEKWFYWQTSTAEQTKKNNIKYELEKLLNSNPNHSYLLSKDEQINISNIVKQTNETQCELDDITQTWNLVYRRNFLKKALKNAKNIKKHFYQYQKSNGLQNEYYDIEMFWRINRMINVTASFLRQQITNRECRRLQTHLKEVLNEYSKNIEIKGKLLTGRRVTLAEELNKVNQIQKKLEDFVQALN